MRGSLSGVRARVERLASRLQSTGGGCAACREDEERIRFRWHDDLAEFPRTVADVLAELPHSNTCDSCGRTYALRYTVLGWET